MNKISLAAAVLTLGSLTACGGNGDDKLADRVENAADQKADAMEAQADKLDDRADQVRDNGEKRADAIDAADVNANALTTEQKNAIVENKAPAVQ